jgi:hypothetical protein
MNAEIVKKLKGLSIVRQLALQCDYVPEPDELEEIIGDLDVDVMGFSIDDIKYLIRKDGGLCGCSPMDIEDMVFRIINQL